MELEDQFGIKISGRRRAEDHDRRPGRRLRRPASVARSAARQAATALARLIDAPAARPPRAGLHAYLLGARPRVVVRAARVPRRLRARARDRPRALRPLPRAPRKGGSRRSARTSSRGRAARASRAPSTSVRCCAQRAHDVPGRRAGRGSRTTATSSPHYSRRRSPRVYLEHGFEPIEEADRRGLRRAGSSSRAPGTSTTRPSCRRRSPAAARKSSTTCSRSRGRRTSDEFVCAALLDGEELGRRAAARRRRRPSRRPRARRSRRCSCDASTSEPARPQRVRSGSLPTSAFAAARSVHGADVTEGARRARLSVAPTDAADEARPPRPRYFRGRAPAHDQAARLQVVPRPGRGASSSRASPWSSGRTAPASRTSPTRSSGRRARSRPSELRAEKPGRRPLRGLRRAHAGRALRGRARLRQRGRRFRRRVDFSEISIARRLVPRRRGPVPRQPNAGAADRPRRAARRRRARRADALDRLPGQGRRGARLEAGGSARADRGGGRARKVQAPPAPRRAEARPRRDRRSSGRGTSRTRCASACARWRCRRRRPSGPRSSPARSRSLRARVATLDLGALERGVREAEERQTAPPPSRVARAEEQLDRPCWPSASAAEERARPTPPGAREAALGALYRLQGASERLPRPAESIGALEARLRADARGGRARSVGAHRRRRPRARATRSRDGRRPSPRRGAESGRAAERAGTPRRCSPPASARRPTTPSSGSTRCVRSEQADRPRARRARRRIGRRGTARSSRCGAARERLRARHERAADARARPPPAARGGALATPAAAGRVRQELEGRPTRPRAERAYRRARARRPRRAGALDRASGCAALERSLAEREGHSAGSARARRGGRAARAPGARGRARSGAGRRGRARPRAPRRSSRTIHAAALALLERARAGALGSLDVLVAADRRRSEPLPAAPSGSPTTCRGPTTRFTCSTACGSWRRSSSSTSGQGGGHARGLGYDAERGELWFAGRDGRGGAARAGRPAPRARRRGGASSPRASRRRAREAEEAAERAPRRPRPPTPPSRHLRVPVARLRRCSAGSRRRRPLVDQARRGHGGRRPGRGAPQRAAAAGARALRRARRGAAAPERARGGARGARQRETRTPRRRARRSSSRASAARRSERRPSRAARLAELAERAQAALAESERAVEPRPGRRRRRTDERRPRCGSAHPARRRLDVDLLAAHRRGDRRLGRSLVAARRGSRPVSRRRCGHGSTPARSARRSSGAELRRLGAAEVELRQQADAAAERLTAIEVELARLDGESAEARRRLDGCAAGGEAPAGEDVSTATTATSSPRGRERLEAGARRSDR